MDKNITGQFIADLHRQKGYTQKEQADKIILDSLNYSKRMLVSTMNVILLIVGIALTISPLFLAGQSFIWVLGAAIVITACTNICLGKRGYSMKLSDRGCYLFAILMQVAALVLEVLPIGVVMVFATGPKERVTEVYSYFSLLPWGYANFTPLLTGILTVVIILLGTISLFQFNKAKKSRKAAFICSIISLLFSLVPLLLFGTIGMTAASYVISGLILFSICLQAVANRKE